MKLIVQVRDHGRMHRGVSDGAIAPATRYLWFK